MQIVDLQGIIFCNSYLRPGSNRHVHNGHRILSPARLPIPPLRHLFKSGKRDSNSRPRPWQGRALPTELFPQKLRFCGFLSRLGIAQTSLALLSLLQEVRLSGKRDSNSRPRPWQGRALPTELFPLKIAVQRYGFFLIWPTFF